jgi:hypothetical protein
MFATTRENSNKKRGLFDPLTIQNLKRMSTSIGVDDGKNDSIAGQGHSGEVDGRKWCSIRQIWLKTLWIW